jgi:hypothetical protein
MPSNNRSLALSSALDRLLLRPLIELIGGYAVAADWTRATLERLSLPSNNPFGVLIDSARRRVLWTTHILGKVQAISFDDLKVLIERDHSSGHGTRAAASATAKNNAEAKAKATATGAATVTATGAGDSKAVPVAGWVQDDKAITRAAHCLHSSTFLAIEPVTQWPVGTDRAAAAAAEAAGLLVGQVGAGALWVANEAPGSDCIVRIDEQSGTACPVAAVPEAHYPDWEFLNTPSALPRLYHPSNIVWDTAHERALVADKKSHCIRAITRAPPPALPLSTVSPTAGQSDLQAKWAQWSAWTVTTLIGSGEEGDADSDVSLAAAQLARPFAIALDPVRPHILYIACREVDHIRIADLRAGTVLPPRRAPALRWRFHRHLSAWLTS